MDATDAARLARLLRTERIAHLGTLRGTPKSATRDGDAGAAPTGAQEGAGPLVSMTLFLPAPDFSAFHIHVSRLAWHTQDMTKDPRVALSVTERDDGREDPFTLARVSIRALAAMLPNHGAGFERLKAAWLARYPAQAINFELADFNFWRLAPLEARFVAGFGSIHNLSAAELAACA
jgi:putative heme iron utilization protein